MAYREGAIPKDEREDPTLAELRALRARVEEQEAQLVEMDAALEGRSVPGARFLEVRRKHAVTLPREILETFFGRNTTWRRPDTRGMETILRPFTYYCSGEIHPRDTTPVCLSYAGPSETLPGGLRSTTYADTNLPRSGYAGLPLGVSFLVTSWYARWEDPERAPNQEATVQVNGNYGGSGDRIVVDVEAAQRESDCLIWLPPREGFEVTYTPQRLARDPAGVEQRLTVFLVGIEGRMLDAY